MGRNRAATDPQRRFCPTENRSSQGPEELQKQPAANPPRGQEARGTRTSRSSTSLGLGACFWPLIGWGPAQVRLVCAGQKAR